MVEQMSFVKMFKTIIAKCLFLIMSGLVFAMSANAHEVEDGWECKVALVKQSQQCKSLVASLKNEVNQAESFYLLGQHDAAFEAFLSLALKGHPSAQFYLAELYLADDGKLDRDQAIYWYQKSAQQGNPNAQYNLANAYYYGDGVPADLLKAISWYLRAAVNGVPEAQLNLGYMYSYGEGVQKNDEAATLLYKFAAKSGNTKAQSNLGFRYCKGVGIEQNLEQCAYWVKKAMDQGHANAKKIWETFKLEQHLGDAEKKMS